MTSATVRQFKHLFPATREQKTNFTLIINYDGGSGDLLQDLTKLVASFGVPDSLIHFSFNIDEYSYDFATGVCMIIAMCLCIMLL